MTYENRYTFCLSLRSHFLLTSINNKTINFCVLPFCASIFRFIEETNIPKDKENIFSGLVKLETL